MSLSLPTSSVAELASHRRAVFASRFLRPPARCKRAEIREKPRRKIGPYENPVRRFVRLREKTRLFSEIPPPRRIPIPKPITQRFLKPVSGVPTVSTEVLQRRLDFFLLNPERSKAQQMAAKLRRGLTPYQAESFMWNRQLTDIRKIYRAQCLQKLAEVTTEERLNQLQLFQQEKRDKESRRAELRNRQYEDKKRRAILKDRLRIERKLTQSVQMSRQSRRKKRQLYYFNKLQNRSDVVTETGIDHVVSRGELNLFSRNIMFPDILKHFG
eukprot:GHVQ01029073.1.p1 GENE.GHVQ01029073.1~~GHVQ01029073.1.p1  ORF type:complete len:270 (+),score=29.51 GHVQ01029073.1:156-965(+)